MTARNSTLFLLTIFLSLVLIHSAIIPSRPFNISHYLYPKVTALTESDIPLQPPHFLQGVLDSISKKEKWALEDFWVSEMDVKKAKYKTVQRYDFRVHVGKIEVALKMHDEASEWKKLVRLSENGTSNFEALARRIGSTAVIDSFKVEGPLELMVVGEDDRLSLTFPLNRSHFGLRRILVGEGISIEVKGAEEISLFHPSNYQFLYGMFRYRRWSDVGSVWPALCTRLLPICIQGSASVVAYRSGRPGSPIRTSSRSKDVIKLLPERCYVRRNYERSVHLPNSLGTRIALLKRGLKSFLNETDNPNTAAMGSLKVRISAFPMYRFPLELRRNIRTNDSYWSTLAEWRTRPSTERVRFEVAARIEGEVLKPLVIKKVRPLNTDSFSWSSLSSNLSFTELPPLFLPPKSLTLDVKW
ncbi:uncharacterized protein LOC121757232 [Salvia splendens]|uniref:uncharacterized protein LOC121757232 n=1 Tax=Salvia splendens TaxID=180675 RepID=UPI001C27E52C|nr:uncharacterized protein LOC121757232 [Salvia splendens]